MKYIKIFEEYITEAKQFGVKDIMKALKNKEDWGDTAQQVYMKGGNLVYVDTWFYGEAKAMKQLEDSWKKGGSNYDYWNKEYGVDFKIVDTFSELKASGKHKKLTTNGIVGVVLKVIPGKVTEAKKLYMTSMDLKDFKKIKKGSNVKYMGSSYTVIKNNGYLLTLKGDDEHGKVLDVNLGMFNHGGMISEVASSTDGGDKSNGNSHHEDHKGKNIAQHWKDIYGEDFHSKYPAIAKIVKSRPGMDRRELKRIWDETYGENFEEQYPALWQKID